MDEKEIIELIDKERQDRILMAEDILNRPFIRDGRRVVSRVGIVRPPDQHRFDECCLILVKHKVTGKTVPMGTGVLWKKNQVLTAGHIVDAHEVISVLFLEDLRKFDPNTTPVGRVDSILIHKNYKDQTYPTNDVAIINLKNSINISPVTTGNENDFLASMNVTVSGFGYDNKWKRNVKRYADDIPLVSSNRTDENHINNQSIFGFGSSSEFVIGGKPCEYDSGGPVYHRANNQRKLIGIISRKVSQRGIPSCKRLTICQRVDLIDTDKFQFINQYQNGIKRKKTGK